ILTLLVITIGFVGYYKSCNKTDFLNPEFSNSKQQNEHGDEKNITADFGGKKMTIGEKVTNVFNIENMKKAFNNLANSNEYKRVALQYSTNISTNYRYIKFLPKNADEANILYKWDISRELSVIPLDRKIISSGVAYRDPACKDRQPTYRYMYVPIDRKLPEHVEYIVLDEMYVPEIVYNLNNQKGKIEAFSKDKINTFNFERLLVVEANNNVNNNLKEHEKENKRKKTVSYNGTSFMRYIQLSGRVQYGDDPFSGININVRCLFRNAPFSVHKNVLTDIYGYFRTEVQAILYDDENVYADFEALANYILIPENISFRITNDDNDMVSMISYHDFSRAKGFVADGNTVPIVDLGTLTFARNPYNDYLITCFKAANHYYFGDIQGLRRPPTSVTYCICASGLTIQCFSGTCPSENGSFGWARETIFGGAAIYIYKNGRTDLSEIYGTTIHELAHASHWEMVKNIFLNFTLFTETIVRESWARGVQWSLTRMKFPNYDEKIINFYYRGNYTGICADLIDPPKIRTSNYYTDIWFVLSYQDRVSGYTIKQLEDALCTGVTTFDDWKDNIINNNTNPSSIYVNEAFRYWNSYNSFTPDNILQPTLPSTPTTPTTQPPLDGEFCYPEQGTNRRVCL
ncbi:MAG: hypothetical protein ORN58_07365, partial [Sediminibacterium sp.]|nr:hypothetical protein [Sediminibacterium sp.]